MNLRSMFAMLVMVLVTIIPRSECRNVRTTTRRSRITTRARSNGLIDCENFSASACPVWEGRCKLQNRLCQPKIQDWLPRNQQINIPTRTTSTTLTPRISAPPGSRPRLDRCSAYTKALCPIEQERCIIKNNKCKPHPEWVDFDDNLF